MELHFEWTSGVVNMGNSYSLAHMNWVFLNSLNDSYSSKSTGYKAITWRGLWSLSGSQSKSVTALNVSADAYIIQD